MTRLGSNGILPIAAARAIACAGLALATLALAACDTSTALEDTKAFIRNAGAAIDNTFGTKAEDPREQLPAEDVKIADAAKQQALETRRDGEPIAWRNVKTGNSGSITPVRTYVTEAGTFCREYREVVSIGTSKEEATATGCRTRPRAWS